jgi:1-acyl-sn-glycerol-3-phosphate acyltransferase|tara:strand:- start:244 stop:900 length:657 start_codon:yes stop_codon:yes gene_type:complete
MPALFFFTTFVKNEIIVARLCRYWSKLTIYFSFIFPKVEWEEKLNKKEQYIFCPNHVSTLDIPFILAVLPMPLQYIGKAEIAKIPLFGYFFKNNSVIVDRTNKRNAYSAFIKAGEKLKIGINMCIFPEGGIPKSDVFLKKFKNGPFRLALDQNIKIVPITMPDSKSMFPEQYFKGRPGIVRIKIHKAIAPNSLGEKSIKYFNLSVYNTIFEQLKNYEQ